MPVVSNGVVPSGTEAGSEASRLRAFKNKGKDTEVKKRKEMEFETFNLDKF